ncbi:hypothetical protein H0H87_010690 [Tephrocybe sp. NHM501043]|nr:hypothetical protein H0H87_010690 [Tephrocybe sp. NHM501043]
MVPSYDHETIWEGYSSLIDEMSTQLPPGAKPNALFCSVGGGGLFGGIITGSKKIEWDDFLVKGIRITWLIATLSKSSKDGFGASKRQISMTSVLHQQAEGSFLDDHKVLDELACSTTLTAAYNRSLFEVLGTKKADPTQRGR